MLDIIDLNKELDIALVKDDDLYDNIRVQLNFESNTSSPYEYDADLVMAQLQPSGRNDKGELLSTIFAGTAGNLIYFKNFSTVDGSFSLDRDDRDGGCETISGSLLKVNPLCNEVSIIAHIYMGVERGQSWKDLKAKLSIINTKTEKVIAQYDLGDQFPDCTGFQFGSFYRIDSNTWGYKNVGIGVKAGFADFVAMWQEKPTQPV